MTRIRSRCSALAAAAVVAVLLATGGSGTSDVKWYAMSGEWFDQAAVVEGHKQRVAEVGEKWERGWGPRREHMLWPDAATMRDSAASATRTKEAREICVAELRRALKPEFVPDKLVDHLAGLSGYGHTKSDFLFGRYGMGHWQIQLVYSGRYVGILAAPIGPVAPHRPTAAYALEVARALYIEPRPQDDPVLEARAVVVNGIAHGGINNPNTGSTTDSPRGPGPWYGGSFITDGLYVALFPSKWHLGDGDIRSNAMMAAPPRMPRPDEQVLLFD